MARIGNEWQGVVRNCFAPKLKTTAVALPQKHLVPNQEGMIIIIIIIIIQTQTHPL